MRWLWLVALTGCGANQLDALSYNIAGLPAGLSSSDPERFIPQMGPLLDAYDLVLVQEDFAYHELLTPQHVHRSEPAVATEQLINDGLNRFSTVPLGPLARVKWDACNGVLDDGSDCLAEKGFSIGTVAFDPRTDVTVVNHHADAGSSLEDVAARAGNFTQLAAALAALDGPLIVAGDTNLKPAERPGDEEAYDAFLDADLQDVCTFLECGDEHIDRFFFRPDGTDLVPTTWAVAGEFVTPTGDDLSDHPAIAVSFTW